MTAFAFGDMLAGYDFGVASTDLDADSTLAASGGNGLLLDAVTLSLFDCWAAVEPAGLKVK